MARDGTQDEISPWTSGSWNFNPRQIGVVGPGNGRPKMRGRRSADQARPAKRSRRLGLQRFGLLPEQEIFRIGYIALFAFSGFVIALLAITLMS